MTHVTTPAESALNRKELVRQLGWLLVELDQVAINDRGVLTVREAARFHAIVNQLSAFTAALTGEQL